MGEIEPVEQYANILIDPLPRFVIAHGAEYPINSDFRTSILFEQLLIDHQATDSEKVIGALELYYKSAIPSDLEAATNGILRFYRCGYDPPPKPRETKRAKAAAPEAGRIFDYDFDAPYLYAAFMSQYRIDLQDIEFLHWWKFSAMFNGISENEKISKIMSYRAVDLSEIKNKEEKNRYARLKAQYALPNEARTSAEKVALAESLFGKQKTEGD